MFVVAGRETTPLLEAHVAAFHGVALLVDRMKEKGRKKGEKRNAEGRLVEGQLTTNWKQALAQLAIAYPDRINPYL